MANELFEIEAVPTEQLIGRTVRFVLRPELQGQITAVHTIRAGRTLTVAYFEGDEVQSIDCDLFQVSLAEG